MVRRCHLDDLHLNDPRDLLNVSREAIAQNGSLPGLRGSMRHRTTI
jgi:hypothetical protein